MVPDLKEILVFWLKYWVDSDTLSFLFKICPEFFSGQGFSCLRGSFSASFSRISSEKIFSGFGFFFVFSFFGFLSWLNAYWKLGTPSGIQNTLHLLNLLNLITYSLRWSVVYHNTLFVQPVWCFCNCVLQKATLESLALLRSWLLRQTKLQMEAPNSSLLVVTSAMPLPLKSQKDKNPKKTRNPKILRKKYAKKKQKNSL